MRRIRVEAVVIAVKQSAVRQNTYYITAEAEGWGTVKYLAHRKHEIGDKVVLQDQWNRIQADKIIWTEVR